MMGRLPILAAAAAIAAAWALPLAAQTASGDGAAPGPSCTEIDAAKPMIQQVAKLPENNLSVQVLDRKLMDKRLAEMSDDDFSALRALYAECAADDVDPDITIDKFVAQVRDAQGLYKTTLEWLDKTLAEIEAMPPTRASMIELNVLYEEMERRATSLTRGDLQRLAAAIDARLTLIQAQAPSRERRSFDQRRSP